MTVLTKAMEGGSMCKEPYVRHIETSGFEPFLDGRNYGADSLQSRIHI